jgi:uncharacterized protein (UPF0335 family)
VVKEVEVPGPERIIEVPGPERVKEVVVPLANEQERRYIQQIQALENTIEDINSKEPEVIEKASSNDLREAARLMAQSELNKEDLTEDDIYNLLMKSSEEDVKKKIGFWAMPLPKDTDQPETNKRYLGKK